LISITGEFIKEPYSDFILFSQAVAYYISKVNDSDAQKKSIEAFMKICDEKLDKSLYNTHLIVLNIIFNCLAPSSPNRMVILKTMIKVCKLNSKEYLFAPYLLNIDDLLDTSVYSLDDQLDIYEDF